MEHAEKFLKTLPLFKSFSEADLEKLMGKSRIKTFATGEAIIKFSQPGTFMGVILSGEAEAVVSGKSGKPHRIGLLKQGDFMGEISLLTGEPTIADVVALSETEVLLIPQEVFSSLLAVNPDALRLIAKSLSERLKIRQQDEESQSRLEKAWKNIPDPYGLDLSTTTPMKILVINCGSSSLKYSYFDTARPENNLDGIVERIGLKPARLTPQPGGDARLISSTKKGKLNKELGAINHGGALKAIISLLTDPAEGVIRDLKEITAIGHRVAHGGDKYNSPVVITAEVIAEIDSCSKLAPLHNPLNLMGIKECMKLMPDIPQVAVFDTGFHQQMPPQAYIYGIPYEYYENDRIRKYGFHGTSHHYVALQAAAHLKRNFRKLKIITCHLGSGASICAIDHGRSVDTTMGFTPLEGLIMGTRCGDIDPSIILYLLREKGLSADQIDTMLNKESGLKGISGISNDFRELVKAAEEVEPRAVLAIHSFAYRIRKYIGAYIASLEGLDVLVFTGGVGEGSAWLRSLACQGLSYMGISIDETLNKKVSLDNNDVFDISSEQSKVKVLVIATDEEKMIARETIRTLGYQNVAEGIQHQREKPIPIEVSAHHVHLSRQEVDALFGNGYALTHRAELSQPGQFACNETVNLIGPKGRVEKVRILAPLRKECQVEISMTEEFKLGIKSPVRASGDVQGSPGLKLEGTKGSYEIKQGTICALRHIHMSPEDALSFGLKDRDVVMVTEKGERSLTFGDVLVRIHPDFRLAMHIDTDEANAASIKTGMNGFIVSVQDRR
jgi:acetate kinase